MSRIILWAGSQTEKKKWNLFLSPSWLLATSSYQKVLPPQLHCFNGLNPHPISKQTFPSWGSYCHIFCWNKKSNRYRQHTFIPRIWLSNVNATKLKDKSESQNVYPFKNHSLNTNIYFIIHLFLMFYCWKGLPYHCMNFVQLSLLYSY